MTNNSHHLLPVEMESDAYFKSIFDNALYGIATTIGTDFRFVSVNDAFCRLLEYDRDELVGVRCVGDVTLPDNYPQNKQLLSSLVNNEIQCFQIEKQYVTKSGRCIEVIVYVLGFYDSDGKYIGSTGSVMDITERKIMERELKRSESKYRGLVDNSMVGVFSSTLNGRFIIVNDTLAEMYDFDSPEQMIGKESFARWANLEQRDRMMTMLQKDGSVTNFETETITDTGRHIHVFLSVKLLRGTLYGMVLDVTEIHQARKELQMSEANLVRAQAVAQFGSWNLDLLENTLIWTDENYKIFGIPKGTPMTYEKFLNRAYPDDRDYIDRKWHAALAGEPFDIEHRLLVDNKIKWVREKAELIINDMGNPISGIGITQDITENKELLHKLIESKKDFQQLAGRLLSVQEEERRRLARELHDDLSQRLAVLVIEAGKVRSVGCSDEAAEILKDVQDKLISISEDVHRISRQLHPAIIEDLGLEQALSSEIHNFSRLENIPVKLEYDIGSVEPSMDIAVVLFRIIQESMRNIQKHAHAKIVSIQLVRENSSLLLTIKDDGRGFAPEIVKNMPGLGLKSMRERIRLINGSISYISLPGQGTTVQARVDIS